MTDHLGLSVSRFSGHLWLVLTTNDGSTDGYRRYYRWFMAPLALWDYVAFRLTPRGQSES